jgi:UPF0176 protein
MRNEYEAKIGHFRNAHIVPMDNFRELPGLLPSMEHLKHKQVITYCTGGIRCEKASALLREHGFDNVRQLEGGIVKYCEQFPDGHFLGSCFVFDDRMSVRYYGKKQPTYLTACEYCGTACDRYLDCCEIPCHALFICCETCERKHAGFCTKCASGKAAKKRKSSPLTKNLSSEEKKKRFDKHKKKFDTRNAVGHHTDALVSEK